MAAVSASGRSHVKSVFLVTDGLRQAAALSALNREHFRTTGELRTRGLTITVHHNEGEAALVEKIVYTADPASQRY